MPAASSPSVADAVFGLLFDLGGDAACVVDRGHHAVLAANAQLGALVGRDPAALIGRRVDELFHLDLDLGGSGLVDTPGRYEDVWLGEPAGAGLDLGLSVSLTVVHLDHPEHGALAACTARDTTERRSLEHDLLAKHASLIAAHGELERTVGELRRTQAMLEDRTREIASMAGQVAQFGWRAAVGEMCATIAHNLNNPVAALQSTLRTIERRAGDQADAAALTPLVARASSAATRIQEHVAAVVNVHRVGSLDVAPRRLDLARELETALALIAGRTSTIDIRRRFAGPVVALAPQDPLQHVLGIVLDNAVKAMPTGGVLDLAIEAQGGRAVVAVADDGVGLPPHIAARLFEPIVTARPTGAGLGLATAQRLARSWGGDIAYRPRPRGACFEISVPAKES